MNVVYGMTDTVIIPELRGELRKGLWGTLCDDVSDNIKQKLLVLVMGKM
jgi:hypothetical protein